MIHEDALALIKAFEGFRSAPYRDAAGVWTIGYGSIRDGEGKQVTALTPAIDEETAEAWLARDALRAEAAVGRLIFVPLGERQAGALASFVYNLGAGALRASTLRRRINDREWDDIPRQFMRWVYAGGRVLPGLVRRRAAEAEMFMG